MSLPTRERGLKPCGLWLSTCNDIVAPHAGAWIETQQRLRKCAKLNVAPHAGAWIETFLHREYFDNNKVAPHAGAWIETMFLV